MTAGMYTLLLKYGGKTVPGFPAKVTADPAVDTSKVKVFGPGVDGQGRVWSVTARIWGSVHLFINPFRSEFISNNMKQFLLKGKLNEEESWICWELVTEQDRSRSASTLCLLDSIKSQRLCFLFFLFLNCFSFTSVFPFCLIQLF